MPESMKKVSLVVWVGALVWSVAGAFMPFASAYISWKCGLIKHPDWGTIWYASAPNALLMATAYWQKCKADLRLPEWAQEMYDYAVAHRVTTTTISQPGTPTITIKSDVPPPPPEKP